MFAVEFMDQFTDEVIKQLEHKLTKNYNPTVSRTEAIEMIGCGATVFNEIKKRDDFQFVKVRGVSNRYSTENLLKWINGNKEG